MKKLLGLLLLLTLAGCIIRPPVPDSLDYFDVTEYDVLDMIDKQEITGRQVTVNGVKLGDTLPQIIRILDVPNYIDEFHDYNIVNVKYEDENGTGLYIFHLVNDTVHRMTIKKGFNHKLIGRSRPRGWELHNITTAFGKPDVTYDTSFLRVYEYHDLNLEIYHKRKDMLGWSVVQ